MGRTKMHERVIERTHDIVATHQPAAISAETEAVIEKVLAEAEARVNS